VCGTDGSCTHELQPDACLINGQCYLDGENIGATETPHCHVCDPLVDQSGWTTPAGLTEDSCNNIDDDCDGETDEWPDPDSFEPNPNLASASPIGQLPGVDQIVSPSDVAETWFHSTGEFEDDEDYYSWTIEGGVYPRYWMCRVAGLLEGQMVTIRLEVEGLETENAWSPWLEEYQHHYIELDWPDFVATAPIFYAAVTPAEGFTPCNNSYELQCRYREDSNTWPYLSVPPVSF
jgi:hypothetical protein